MDKRLPVPALIPITHIFQQPVPQLLDISTVENIFKTGKFIPDDMRPQLIKQILENVNLEKLENTKKGVNQKSDQLIKLEKSNFKTFNGKEKNPNYKKFYHQGDDKKYYCELCEYTCKSKTSIINHRNIKHTKDYIKKYECLVCKNYSVNHKSELISHLLRIHSKECDIKATDMVIH
jgi:hypothetical protein